MVVYHWALSGLDGHSACNPNYFQHLILLPIHLTNTFFFSSPFHQSLQLFHQICEIKGKIRYDTKTMWRATQIKYLHSSNYKCLLNAIELHTQQYHFSFFSFFLFMIFLHINNTMAFSRSVSHLCLSPSSISEKMSEIKSFSVNF